MPRPRYRKSVRVWKRAAISSTSGASFSVCSSSSGSCSSASTCGLDASSDSAPRAWPRRSASRYSATSCDVNALVDATPISGPGVRVDRAVGLARRHAADDVADREAAGAAALRLAQRRERVGGLAGLRDHDGQRVRRHDRAAVAVLRAVVDLDRHARELLDHELADQRRRATTCRTPGS